MDEATKAKLKAAGLEGVVTAYEKMASDLKAASEGKAAAEKLVAEKDAVITQKNDDIVNLRKASEKKYKTLQEMTEAEKAALSDKEKELLERQEKFDADLKAFQEQQTQTLQKEIGARRSRAFDKLVGTKDPELRKKIEESFGKIKDSDKAQTDEEIAAIAQSAFNMLGVPRPEGVRQAINESGGGEAGVGGETDFSTTDAGKNLSQAMGLPVAPPQGGAA